MIPVGDVVPRRTTPTVTVVVAGVLAVSLLAFHLTLRPEQQLRLLWRWGAFRQTVPWPALATSSWLEPLWASGSANIAALLLFGPAVEDRLGHARFILMWALVACLGATVTAGLSRPPSLPAAGAAAPAAAVMATYLTLFPQSKIVFWMPGLTGGSLHEVPLIWVMASWMLLVPANLARYTGTGYAGMAPFAAIIAGILIGLASASVLVRRERLLVTWWDEYSSGPGTRE